MIWVIGDIHGMFDPLNELIKIIRRHQKFDSDLKSTKIIFLGDYIDFGPSSKEVIDLLLEIKEEFDVVFLAGNHDDMIIQYINETDLFKQYSYNWIQDNGVKETLISLSPINDLEKKLYRFNFEYIKWEDLQIADKYTEFFKSLKYSHLEELKGDEEIYKFIFTHGCINTEIDIEEQINIKSYNDFQKYLKDKNIWIENSFLWNRKMPKSPFENYINVHGHTTTLGINRYYHHKGNYDVESGMPYFNFGYKEVLCKYNKSNCTFYDCDFNYTKLSDLTSINIDTGAILGKYLTAIMIPEVFAYSKEMKVVQVSTSGSRRENNNQHFTVNL